jgi:hypothetical protein
MRTLFRGLAGALLILGVAALGTGPDGLSAQDKKKDPKGKDPKSPVVVPPAKKPAEDLLKKDARDKTVGISTSDGLSLNAYWYQGTAAEKNAPDAVLMFPAPGGKVTDAWIGLAKALSEKNFSVLLLDWRGCGMNAAETAGPRILDSKELFWKEPYNSRLLKANERSIEDKGLSYASIVNKAQGNTRYKDFLFNDLLGARFFLDKQNDNGKCNSSRIWIVTEKEGGQMALAFIASEFPRNSIYDPNVQIGALGRQFRSAGKDFVGLTCLSYQGGNASASGVYSKAFSVMNGELAKDARDHLERRLAMIMVHGKKEGPSGSKSAFGLVGAGGDADALKKNYKYLREMDNSKAGGTLSGIGLIDPMDSFGTQKDIVTVMTEVSKVLPGGKDKVDREANKMVVIPRFPVEQLRR